MPALIVVVSLGATQADGYGTEFACWLSVESNLIWAFVGPAFFVIVVRFLQTMNAWLLVTVTV